jgi:hypothetical protein
VWFLGGVLRKVGAKRGFLMGGTWFLVKRGGLRGVFVVRKSTPTF